MRSRAIWWGVRCRRTASRNISPENGAPSWPTFDASSARLAAERWSQRFHSVTADHGIGHAVWKRRSEIGVYRLTQARSRLDQDQAGGVQRPGHEGGDAVAGDVPTARQHVG